MAKNTGRGLRTGTREQRGVSPRTALWTRPNSSSGAFMRADAPRPIGADLMGNYDRANPLVSALTKAGTAVSALGGVVTYLVTSSVISASQGEAVTVALADAQETAAHVGGAIAGVLAIVAGLSAAFVTVQVGKQGTTPTVDPRTDTGGRLVPAPLDVPTNGAA